MCAGGPNFVGVSGQTGWHEHRKEEWEETQQFINIGESLKGGLENGVFGEGRELLNI